MLADRLLEEFGLKQRGWTFRFNKARRSLGLCRYHDKRIELSQHFVAGASPEAIRETLLHEIAHALAGPRSGHGERWKAMCLKVGARPQRLASPEEADHLPKGPWRATCAACGQHFHRFRKPPDGSKYWCRKCGPKTGTLQFERHTTPH